MPDDEEPTNLIQDVSHQEIIGNLSNALLMAQSTPGLTIKSCEISVVVDEERIRIRARLVGENECVWEKI